MPADALRCRESDALSTPCAHHTVSRKTVLSRRRTCPTSGSASTRQPLLVSRSLCCGRACPLCSQPSCFSIPQPPVGAAALVLVSTREDLAAGGWSGWCVRGCGWRSRGEQLGNGREVVQVRVGAVVMGAGLDKKARGET
jgi:hypothetical protein